MDRQILQKCIQENKHFTKTRKVSLFSNFARLHDQNPDGFDANITAWKDVLEDAVQQHAFTNKTIIHANQDLVSKLMDQENGFPLSLNCVFDQLVESRVLMPLDQFNTQYSSITKPLVSKIVSFGWNKMFASKFSSGEFGKLNDVQYVHIPSVEKYIDVIIEELTASAITNGKTHASQVFNLAEVEAIVSNKNNKNNKSNGLTTKDVQLCLQFGSSKSLIYYDGEIIKLKQAGNINSTDSTIISLKSHTDLLTLRLKKLKSESKKHEETARECLKTEKHKDKNHVKQILARKAIVDKIIEQTTSQISQLESVLFRIDTANDNKQTVDVLQSSAKMLKTLNSRTDIQNVEDLHDELAELVGDTDLVSKELASMNLDKSQVDEEAEELELDMELEKLAEEERGKIELPSAPKHKISGGDEAKTGTKLQARPQARPQAQS